jgi:hypothetical protein
VQAEEASLNPVDILKNLLLDTWYKVLVYVGGIIFVASLFVEVKAISNGQLQLLAGGITLLGLGEWKNHKERSWIKPPNVYTGGAALMTATVREPDLVGVLLQLLGGVLIALSAWSIFQASLVSTTLVMPTSIPTVVTTPTVTIATPTP